MFVLYVLLIGLQCCQIVIRANIAPGKFLKMNSLSLEFSAFWP